MVNISTLETVTQFYVVDDYELQTQKNSWIFKFYFTLVVFLLCFQMHESCFLKCIEIVVVVVVVFSIVICCMS